MPEHISKYHAHYNPDTDEYQSIYAHLQDTAAAACKKNSISYIESIIHLASLLHDAGKYPDEWQTYFENRIQYPDSAQGEKMDHATAGGQLIEELAPHTVLSELIQTAIYSHHGLQDCVSCDDSSFLSDRRRRKAESLPVEECRLRFYEEFDKKQIEALCVCARKDAIKLLQTIQNTMTTWKEENLYGNRDFFLGMYERLLISLLIDADRRNTEDFMTGEDTQSTPSTEELQRIWTSCITNLENHIAGLEKKTNSPSNQFEINWCRSEISRTCRDMAEKPQKRFRLTVPTGAGKTLSSLRFAVHHAARYNKKRIIYVAPFHSIVEQNADEIRNALGMPELILEHHCNIVLEGEAEQARYDRITEDWSLPVIVTTAVQFLNTLFADKTGNVRRMHSLCDSIIIMDEAQALPVRIMELFNLAVNFLTEFAGATVVLCTATQPLLNDLPRNRLRPCGHMVPEFESYEEGFRRTKIVDDTMRPPGGMDASEAAIYILEKAERYQSVLFIANTKACARRIYKKVLALCEGRYDVRHLSTSMCPKHRSDVLEKINENLSQKKPQICISTQMIEAGVNISFGCVIRSLAGLDNVIQSAGRCNRHREAPLGYVFIVKMCEEMENLSHLKDIRFAQQAMQSVLCQFSGNPESLDGRLDSQKAITMYFQIYYVKRLAEMCYQETVEGVPTNLVDLLSSNPAFAPKAKKGPILKQAFKTAGEKFEAIEDSGKITLLIPYDETARGKLAQLEEPYLAPSRKKQLLRELQVYTVSVTQTERRQLEAGIHGIWDSHILVLDERFYDRDIGVTSEPAPLPELFI